MSQEKLVSIVLAIYQGDADRYIRNALASILDQSYQSLEIIIIVDGSIDEAKNALLNQYSQDNRFKIIRLPQNRGPAAARNMGIRAAQGKYIAIMDADDVSHKDRIAIQKSYLEKESLDLVSSSMHVIDEIGTIIGERVLPMSLPEIRIVAPYSCPLNNPAVFAKARVFKENLYNENYRISEDYELWVRLLLAGYQLGNMPEKTVFYRQSRESLAKRRGIKHACSDLRVKWRAVTLAPWYQRPSICVIAVLAAGTRLLPNKLFGWLYKSKATLYRWIFG